MMVQLNLSLRICDSHCSHGDDLLHNWLLRISGKDCANPESQLSRSGLVTCSVTDNRHSDTRRKLLGACKKGRGVGSGGFFSTKGNPRTWIQGFVGFPKAETLAFVVSPGLGGLKNLRAAIGAA